MEIMKAVIDDIIKKLLATLTERQREVIEARYGLTGGKPLTLARVGKTYGVTRERVRQIEASALSKIRETKGDAVHPFTEIAADYFKRSGGVRREDLLVSDFRLLVVSRENDQSFGDKVKFLLEISDGFECCKEDDVLYTFWYSSKDLMKKAMTFTEKLYHFFKDKKQQLINHKEFDKLFGAAIKPHGLQDFVGLNYVSISKRFGVNQYGDFGLTEWAEVEPKTVRDWSYLVLKEEKKPLHFTELSKMIGGMRKAKATNAQTVHNELIKDPRFVLVGRGLYALQEHGYEPGTAREVIARLFKKHGPLKPAELIKLVATQRILKENTITINLHNKKHFMRLPDGRYSVREA